MKPKRTKHFVAFDGLRCYACLLVLASHVQVLGQGGFANRLFFVLSGFLCVRYAKEEVFFSVKEIIYYYLKKMIRILPSFYLILFGIQFFTLRFTKQELIDNMLFVRSTGVWWFLQHTVVFYLFVPFIHIIIALIRKILKVLRLKYSAVQSLCIAISLFACAYYFSKHPLFYLNGNGIELAFSLDMFMIGMGFRYVYEIIDMADINYEGFLRYILDLLTLVLLASFIFTSKDILGIVLGPEYSDYLIGWQRPYLCEIIAGALIISLALNSGGYMYKLLSHKYLVSVGQVSLLMYLTHTFMIPYITLRNKYIIYLYLVLSCFSLSFIIYHVYEKPVGDLLNRFLNILFRKNKGQAK